MVNIIKMNTFNICKLYQIYLKEQCETVHRHFLLFCSLVLGFRCWCSAISQWNIYFPGDTYALEQYLQIILISISDTLPWECHVTLFWVSIVIQLNLFVIVVFVYLNLGNFDKWNINAFLAIIISFVPQLFPENN